MALTNFMHALQCSQCLRSWHGLDMMDKGFRTMMREAYAKGWVTTYKSRYDGGDGEERAYCPYCAPNHRENRFTYEF